MYLKYFGKACFNVLTTLFWNILIFFNIHICFFVDSKSMHMLVECRINI
jgi:hypothetical protein